MIGKLTIHADCPEGERPGYNWGSLLHGALMELLPPELADTLHEEGVRPFSQYAVPAGRQSLEWRIGLLDRTFSGEMVRVMSSLRTIDVRHKGITLSVNSAESKMEDERRFMSRFFEAEKPCRRYELEFITPCTHKSAGEYVPYPTPDLIFRNLAQRFNEFAENYSLDDPEAIDGIIAHTRIAGYRLRSSTYCVNGARIMGYTGSLTLSVSGPPQLARLAGALLSYGEYAGIGIKTSLGMGGCLIRPVLGACETKNAAPVN